MANFYARYNGGLFGGGGGGGGGSVKANVLALASAATTASVTFATAFTGGTPVVVAWLTSSNPTADLISIQGYTVSAAGFSAELSTQTPDNTYTLNWIASAVNDS